MQHLDPTATGTATPTVDQPAAAAAGDDGGGGHIEASALRKFVTLLLLHKNSTRAEAETVATHLVEANLKGHDSHGVGMLPQYFNSVDRGLLHPNAPLRTISDIGPMLVFDAGQGYGQVAARTACLAAIERAREYGVCVYALRRAAHIGRVGAYAELAAEAGYVYTSWTNVGDHAPLVAPDGETGGVSFSGASYIYNATRLTGDRSR
jgi:uncharacterized oxidoreductase